MKCVKNVVLPIPFFRIWPPIPMQPIHWLVRQSAPVRVDEAIDIIRAELSRMAQHGPNAKELEAAKKYIIGSYAIRNLDTSQKVASVLVAIQQIDLGIDYIDRREDIINSVTLEDVKRAAANLLKQKPTLVIVGPAKS